MLKPVLNKLGLKRLEPYDGKLSRTVLRGWKSWKQLFYYPTMIFMLYSTISFAESNLDIEKLKRIHQMRQDSLDNKDLSDFAKIHQEKIKALGAVHPSNAALIIFISSSMSKNNIKELIESAKDYRANVVLRGFIDGSFKETTEYLAQFFAEEDADIGITIDPTLFDEFNIQIVPSFVIAKDNKYDKLAGNIPLKTALEEFVKQGELSQEAASFLGDKK